MKRHVWIVGAFLMVVLLVAAEMAIISNASGYEAKEKVVFAAERISKNTIITGDMLELREISTDAVHPGALKSMDIALSKRAVMDIETGEMLLNVKLSADDDGMIEAVGKNNRLFSLELDVDQANGWQLTEDQYVDIIYVPNNSEVRNRLVIPEGKEEVQEGQSISGAGTADDKRETGGVEVAAEEKSDATGVGSAVQEKSDAAGMGAAAQEKSDTVPAEVSGHVSVMKHIRIAGIIDEDGKLVDISKEQSLPRYISFEVTQEQAVFLAYAKRNGKLELACIPDK